MVQMMNTISISRAAPTSTQPSASPDHSLPQPPHPPLLAHSQSYPSPNPPDWSAPTTATSYYSSPVPTIQTPISPLNVPAQPATAPPISRYRPPSPSVSPRQAYQQHYHTFPLVQPVQYTSSLSVNTPPSQFLSPSPSPSYSYQQPVQSPYFSGNTTASTYKASFEYNAPQSRRRMTRTWGTEWYSRHRLRRRCCRRRRVFWGV